MPFYIISLIAHILEDMVSLFAKRVYIFCLVRTQLAYLSVIDVVVIAAGCMDVPM